MLLTSAVPSFAAEPQAAPQPPREKSAFEQALEHNQSFATKERWVEINGTRYREIEYHGEKYYMHALGVDNSSAQLDCDLPSGTLNPHLTEAGVEIHRTRAFVQLLQESCTPDAHGQRQVRVALDPRIGITLPDGPKDKLKKKTISVNPLTPGVGFSSEW